MSDKVNDITMDKYTNEYSEDGLWNKITKNVQSIGGKLIYNALQLYYATENPACPMKVKGGIYAALGYLILPFDLIPDFSPIVGYGDDASAIAVSITMAQMYIDDEVKAKARARMVELFGEKILRNL